MVNVFDNCTDSCGWVAALIAALAYGSFGVPVKATKHIDVHPLVLQSYKTVVVFISCWLMPLFGVEVSFTKWGLLSGLLWVIGGTGGIYGIRMAGLAIAVGTWASIMIMVNFIFGILIFREPVYDILGTMAAFLLLVVGLVGMSHYSAPQKSGLENSQNTYQTFDEANNRTSLDGQLTYETFENEPNRATLENPLTDDRISDGNRTTAGATESSDKVHYSLFGVSLNKRQCGILGAAMNGVFTGGSLIPLHYAKEEGFGGANYIISMSTGAFLANCLLLICFFLYNMLAHKASLQNAWDAMPPLHFKELWRAGFSAGFLLAIAMFGSIFAVTYLGQGVGNSLVQTKIIISGLWGIFFYKEINGLKTITLWFTSATLAVVAIIWLSLERLFAASRGEGGNSHRILDMVFDL